MRKNLLNPAKANPPLLYLLFELLNKIIIDNNNECNLVTNKPVYANPCQTWQKIIVHFKTC